jgi:hypothetical protein
MSIRFSFKESTHDAHEIIEPRIQRSILSDVSVWFLLLSNLITIFFAIKENWNLAIIMWVYCFQSIIIGLFNFKRIITLKDFSTEGFLINNKPVEPTERTKKHTAFFFLLHYGFFHVVYISFLFPITYSQAFGDLPAIRDIVFIVLAVLFFFINHAFSYSYNKSNDTKKQNIGTLMFYPYARIVPMHFTIILGFFTYNLLFFLILKTLADIIMHNIEHTVLRR